MFDHYFFRFQSTRPLRGATSTRVFSLFLTTPFQSTRPLRGATKTAKKSHTQCSCFNPRDPCEARLRGPFNGVCKHLFQSTRPLRGATKTAKKSHTQCSCFNPRAPCEARLRGPFNGVCKHLFQSTRPLRGATVGRNQLQSWTCVSIHAPFARRDLTPKAERGYSMFQSTRPLRGATCRRI